MSSSATDAPNTPFTSRTGRPLAVAVRGQGLARRRALVATADRTEKTVARAALQAEVVRHGHAFDEAQVLMDETNTGLASGRRGTEDERPSGDLGVAALVGFVVS